MIATTVEAAPLLSIVIPAYNCGQWLRRAVESTERTGVEPLEVIVVDDGSTDQTPEICRDICAKRPWVRYYYKSNGGLSSARNLGFAKARGDYVLLLDADDELLPNINVGQILSAGADVIRIGVLEEDEEGVSQQHLEPSEETSGKRYLHSRFGTRSFYTPSVSYIYRREWLNHNGLRFVPGLLHEDMLFTVQALLAAEQLVICPALVYHYIRRSGSITRAIDEKKALARMSSLSTIAKELTNLANKHRDVDFRWWIDEIIHNAAALAQYCPGIRPRLWTLMMQMLYMITYRGWHAPGFRLIQRLRFKKLLFAYPKFDRRPKV